MSAADPEALSRDVAAPSHLIKRVQKGKRCSKGWKRVYSTGSETRGKVCPYTQTTQGVGRTTVAIGTLKAATKVLDQEQRSPLLRDVITKGHPREERRSYQKARVAPEVIGSQKNARVWFDDLPKETIDSYDDLKKAFLENYLQQKKCIKDPVEIHNIRQRDGESTEKFVRREVGHNTDEWEDKGTEGPMIIEAEIKGHCVHHMYVDGRSASEIMYEHCFSRLRPEIKKQLIPATTPLIGFSGEIIWPIGQIQLLVTIGDEEHSASALMSFVVVRSPSSYNGIIGRPGVRKLHAVPSTVHEMLKILVGGGVITLKSSRLVPLECAMVSGPERTLPNNESTVEERIKVAINPEYPE
ncbi:reverse transcriptase domain-containing protein [Tanacetum coccineum]